MADTAEAVKKTIEQTTSTAKVQAEKVQAAGAQAFKDGLEKTTASLSELGVQSKQNLEALTASATAAQKGAEALSAQALSYGKTSWESGVAAAQTFAKARSVQELIELQTSFTKSAMEVYMAEMTKMTETLTSSVKDSFKPINERVTASVEKFQAAR
jgi:phasin family protein